MSIFCTNCGSKLSPGAKFCTGCGKALLTRAEGNAPAARPMPEADAQRQWTQYGQPPQYHQPVASPRPAPVRQRRRTSSALAAVSGVMAIVCLCVFVLLPLIKRMNAPEGSASGRAAGTATATVSAENPIAEVAGARIDANILNLHGGEKTLTVTRGEAVRDDETGNAYVEYDIALGDTHHFAAPITIALPYDEALAAGGWSGIAHYDADYGLWIPLDTRIDRAAGTATARLTSLSPVRMAYHQNAAESSMDAYYIFNDGHSNARMEVSSYYWQAVQSVPLTTAERIARDFLHNGNTQGSASVWLDPGDVAYANTVATLGGAAGALLPVGGTLLFPTSLYPAAASAGTKISDALGILSLSVAGVQLVSDCLQYGVQDDRTAVNFMKNIATNGSTLLSFTSCSATGLSLCFSAVALIGVGLDWAVEEAENIQADTTAAIFNTYYNDPAMPGYIDDAHWYRFFSNVYYTAWQDGGGTMDSYEAATEALKQEIDRHAEFFWKDIYRDGSDALSFAVAEAGKSNYYTPTPAHKTELTAKYKQDLYKRLQSIYSKWVNEFMLERLQRAVYSDLWTAAKPLNDYYRVIVQEIAPPDSGELCKYQNYTLRFVRVDEGGVSFATSDYPKKWTLAAPEDDDEWVVQTDFTMLGYIQAGMPNAVALFPPDSDTDELNDAEHVVEFALQTLDSGPTVIDLSGGDDISGVYNVTGTYTGPIHGTFEERPFQARVEQNGEDMKVVFTLSSESGRTLTVVLTGVYDESTKTFTGRSKERVVLYASHDSTIVFDTNATPIQAAWEIAFEIYEGPVSYNYTMIKVAKP